MKSEKIKFVIMLLIIAGLSGSVNADEIQQSITGSDVFSQTSMSSSGDLIAVGYPGTGILALITKDGSPIWAYCTGLNISGVAISGNGEYISCVSREGDVLLFDNSGNLLLKDSVRGYKLKTLLSENGSTCLVYNDDLPDDLYTHTLHVFDINGTEFFSKRVPGINSADLSSDGDYFFAGTSMSTRGRLYSKSREVIWEYKEIHPPSIWTNPGTSASDDLNLIGIVDFSRVRGFDRSGNELFNKSLLFLIGETPEFYLPTFYLDVAGDGSRLVTGSEFIVYCLNNTGSTLWSFEFEDAVCDDISSAAVSYDGGPVAASCGNNLYVLDENGDVRSKYDIDLPVKRIFISDDGDVVAGGATGGIVYLLSGETGLISIDVGGLSVQPLPTVGVPTQTPAETEQTVPVSFALPLLAFVITLVLQNRRK